MHPKNSHNQNSISHDSHTNWSWSFCGECESFCELRLFYCVWNFLGDICMSLWVGFGFFVCIWAFSCRIRFFFLSEGFWSISFFCGSERFFMYVSVFSYVFRFLGGWVGRALCAWMFGRVFLCVGKNFLGWGLVRSMLEIFLWTWHIIWCSRRFKEGNVRAFLVSVKFFFFSFER